jgi:nucleoside-diphosphate-sugar epimerase
VLLTGHTGFVEDAVSAYMVVAESLEDPNNRGRAWNAGVGHPVTVLDVVRALIDRVRRRHRAGHPGAGRARRRGARYWLDSTGIRGELGWSPEWDPGRGLEATYDWSTASLRRQVWE